MDEYLDYFNNPEAWHYKFGTGDGGGTGDGSYHPYGNGFGNGTDNMYLNIGKGYSYSLKESIRISNNG
jgi:hypothetical protein